MASASHAAKPEDASRRFLNELIARELDAPVDRFVAERAQPEADAILERYRAQLEDLAARLQALSTGALDAVALFRSATAQAAEQLRDDAERELGDAFAFAARIDSTAALQSYIAARVEEVFTAAAMTAAADIRPLLARLLPPEPEASPVEAGDAAPPQASPRKRRASRA